MRRFIVTTFIGVSLWAGAAAAEPNDPVSTTVESLTRGLVQERDVALVFRYLRDAFGAAIEGREVPPPDELTQRADAIAEEAKRRGAAAGRAILDAIEHSVRDKVREPTKLPPVSPLQRI